MLKRSWNRFSSGLLILILCAGCVSAPEPAPAEGPWTPSELSFVLSGNDPLEGFNRSMFAVTDFGMEYIVDPLGRVYTSILPRPAIEKFDNLCVNLEFPARAFSCLGRAEFGGTWDEFCRFLINTTVGIAGLFDPAGAWFEIYSTDSDFGQMFAAWGIGPGCTLFLPFLSSLNVRDGVGSIFDMAFDIKTYIPYAGYATALNRMVVAHRAYEKAVSGSADRYKTYHEMMLLRRQLQLRMYFYHALNAAATARKTEICPDPPPERAAAPKPEWVSAEWRTIPGFQPQDPVLDTMRVAMFQPQNDDDPWYFRLSVFNRDFTKKCDLREIRFGDEMPSLRYAYWHSKDAEAETVEARLLAGKNDDRTEKLLLLLPGIGGSSSGTTQTALAELFHRNGWSVAVLDSTFTWNFYLASGGKLPGFLAQDGENLRHAIALVLDDLKGAKLFNPFRSQITLMGYSFGAMHTLKIAELEQHSNRLGIDHYVAINPPVDLRYAMKQADALAGTGRDWNADKAVATVVEIAGKAMGAIQNRYPPYDPEKPEENPFRYDVPLTQEEADYLAALYFKISMRELLLTAHREKGLPALSTQYRWGRRTELYREIDRVCFEEYAEKFISPELAPLTLEEIYAQSNLRAFGDSLATNPKVRVMHNVDDFLLSEEDRRFLDRTFGKRLIWFDCGGHLGNLYVKSVQQTLLELAEGNKESVITERVCKEKPAF